MDDEAFSKIVPCMK